METDSEQVCDWIARSYDILHVLDSGESGVQDFGPLKCDLFVRVTPGYGVAFTSNDCNVTCEQQYITFERSDYLLQTDRACKNASIQVHDAFSFRHVMMNLYSTFIVHHNWGLLMHSCCAVENGQAFLFLGRSGAGKSTVARLSTPRRLLSDEASIVRIRQGVVEVLDSPFRSETRPDFDHEAYPLRAIHLLTQSVHVRKHVVPPEKAMTRLMDKLFYWSSDPQDTRKIFRLYRMLLDEVPVYELEFQKNNLFWEAIS